MVCKYCGCENLDGSTHCVYCGEPLSDPDSSIGSIMSAFAGVAVDENAEDEAAGKRSGITVISAVNRLRRTDVSSESVNREEEELARQEMEALLSDAQAEQIELNWNEAEEKAAAAREAAEQKVGEITVQADEILAAAEEAAAEEKSLSDQAAEIVSRAVAKIVGDQNEAPGAPEKSAPEAPAPAAENAGTEAPAETAAAAAAAAVGAAAAGAAKPYRVPEQPESPFNFHLEEIAEKEEAPEEAPPHNFVLAAAEAVPAGPVIYKAAEEKAPEAGAPEKEAEDEFFDSLDDQQKDGVDFIPSIALTGTSQIMKETREEKERVKKEETRKAAEEEAAWKRTRAAKRRRTNWIWIFLLLLSMAALAYLLWIRPMQRYEQAVEMMEKGNYREALSLFEQSGDYKDSRRLADECLAKLGVLPTDHTTPVPTETLPDASESTPVPSTPAESKPDDTTAEPAETTPPVTEEPESTPDVTSEPETETTPEASVVLEPGQIVVYGRYEQDNDFGNGKEEIEWIVLEAEDGKACLISRYILDSIPFLEPSRWATYSSSNIRIWLFDTFYNAAFSDAQKNDVLVYDIKPGLNPSYPGTPQGADVDDEVGFLSVEQVEHYFPSATDKQCTATVYALERGVFQAANGFSPWWTCTMGKDNESACLVRSDGAINYGGRELTVRTFGVRPVIWINTEALAD